MTGTVLLAEDRPDLRTVFKELLQLMGFRVLDCIDGQDAIEVAERFEERIDLIVTDVGMPRVGGLEAAKTIRRKHPETKVLYMSGYVDNGGPANADADGAQMLRKPFTPDELAERIQQVLAA